MKKWLTGALAACVCSTGMLFGQSGTLQPLPYLPPGTNPTPAARPVNSAIAAPVTPAAPSAVYVPVPVPPVPTAPANSVLVPVPTPPIPSSPPMSTPRSEFGLAPAPGQIKTVQAPKEGAPEAIPAPIAPPPLEAPVAEEPIYSGKRHGHRGGCASCGGGGCSTCGPTGGCIGCGAGMRCYPGRNPCCDCDHDTCLGRLWCGLYQCICCPDPCYEGKFIPEANSAFWVDSARPWTQTRLRFDLGYNFRRPDRNEFFWARTGGGIGKGPNAIEARLNYSEFSLSQEIAAKNFSFTIETPYRSVDPIINPDGSGFGDMNIAAKTLLLDCDLLQIGTQFRTYLPVGQARKGLGVGHVSLEPSLLMTMKLLPETYLQSQVSEWIPIAGDPDYAGSLLHYHVSINHVMYRFMPDVLLIGSAEFSGYSFQDGAFSDPILGLFQGSSGGSYLYAGPSLRLSICNRVDLGGSAQFSLDSGGGAEQIYRMEMRLRF